MALDVDLTVLADRLVPGPGTRFDRVSLVSRDAVRGLVARPGVRPAWRALYGNDWLGHPLHSIVIAVPVGAWAVSGWYDLRGARSGDARFDAAADGALRVGLLGALAAAVTGVAQYVDTDGQARRETTMHSSLNTVALVLYTASWAARRRGSRRRARLLSGAALGVVGASGYLGGDLTYRHGVGVRW